MTALGRDIRCNNQVTRCSYQDISGSSQIDRRVICITVLKLNITSQTSNHNACARGDKIILRCIDHNLSGAVINDPVHRVANTGN